MTLTLRSQEALQFFSLTYLDIILSVIFNISLEGKIHFPAGNTTFHKMTERICK